MGSEMKQSLRMIRLVSVFPVFFLAIPSAISATLAELQKIELKPTQEKATLILSYKGNSSFKVSENKKNGTVVIESPNLLMPARLARPIDTASKESPVSQLTPYSVGGGNKSSSKFVLQVRGNVDVISSELPGKYVVEIRRELIDSKSKVFKGPGVTITKNSNWLESDSLTNIQSANEKSAEIAQKLVEVLNAPADQKKYFGSPVTFEAEKASVHDVFRLVGLASNLNIVTDAEVSAQADFSVRDIPWDQLLDIVVQQANLKAAVSGNVVRIMTATRFTADQEEKLKQVKVVDELEPVVMAVIPLNFAKAADMQKMIDTLLIKKEGAGASAQQSGGGSGGTSAVGQDFRRGQIQLDERSNSLVITNTKEAIARIRALVKELDTPLPQVLIDSKLIIAQENFSKQVGVTWNGAATSSGSGRAGVGATFPGGSVQLGTAESSEGAPAYSIAGPAGGLGFGFQIGAGRHGNLGAQIALAETNGVAKTVASPRILVNNKTAASIVDGQTIVVQTAAGANGSGSIERITAQLNLTVTPQVTSTGSVLLDVNITKDSPAPGGTAGSTVNKSLRTSVLVDSGDTLVLGGVYVTDSLVNSDGIPLLKDLPFIGQLFRTDSASNSKNEMMVFISPQIMMPPSGNPDAALPSAM